MVSVGQYEVNTKHSTNACEMLGPVKSLTNGKKPIPFVWIGSAANIPSIDDDEPVEVGDWLMFRSNRSIKTWQVVEVHAIHVSVFLFIVNIVFGLLLRPPFLVCLEQVAGITNRTKFPKFDKNGDVTWVSLSNGRNHVLVYHHDGEFMTMATPRQLSLLEDGYDEPQDSELMVKRMRLMLLHCCTFFYI